MKLTDKIFSDEKTLSSLKDPFKQDLIEKIWIHIGKTFMGEVSIFANVEFKNGDTEGKHKIQAESFPVLCQKIQDFIDSLEKK